MAWKKCPSCGAPFNGRKCKNCFYETFTEEIAHGLHTHEGEPLVIEGKERKTIRRRYGRRNPPKWLKTAIVWILLINLLPLGVEYIQEGIIDGVRTPEPEPMLSSLAVRLWEGEDITVWTEPGNDPLSIPILVENNSRDDIAVTADIILLDEVQTEEAFLYVEAGSGSWGRGYLYLDEEEMKAAAPVEQILFCLDIYDSDSYDTLVLKDPVILPY